MGFWEISYAAAANNDLFRPKKSVSSGVETLTCGEYLSSDGKTSPIRLLFSIWLNGYSAALSGEPEQFNAEFVARANKLVEDACTKGSQQSVFEIVVQNTLQDVAASSHKNHLTPGSQSRNSVQTQNARRSVGKCDELAASEFDENRLANGVSSELLLKHSADAKRFCLEAKEIWPNDPVIAFQLGRALHVNNDISGAVAEYQSASDAGHLVAKHNLGVLYLSENSEFGTPEKGLALIEEAVDSGSALAKLQYGQLYMGGKHLPFNPSKAAKYYEEAVSGGVVEASHDLAVLYKDGIGVPKDLSKARKLFMQAEEHGVAAASFYLGLLYETGEGVFQDDAKAFTHYKKAAEGGIPEAQTKVGIYIWVTKPNHEGYKESLKWFRWAARQNNPVATYYVGLAYWNGLGVVRNSERACPWFERSARQGYADAWALVAACQVEGVESPASNKDAVNSMVAALAGGSTQARFFMIDQKAEAWGKEFRMELQRFLRKAGFYSGGIDGKFGKGTLSAIEQLFNFDEYGDDHH